MSTPSGGLHAYFTGSDQPSGRMPRQHLDFRARGGYILAPPSQIDGKPYRIMSRPGGHGSLIDNLGALILVASLAVNYKAEQIESHFGDGAAFAAVQLARLTGDRTRDLLRRPMISAPAAASIRRSCARSSPNMQTPTRGRQSRWRRSGLEAARLEAPTARFEYWNVVYDRPWPNGNAGVTPLASYQR